MAMPARSLTERLFRGEAARMLVAGNAGHADIGLESPGSAAMGLLLALLGQTVGFPVPRGGAGRLSTAMVRRLETRGGEPSLGERAEGVRVERGRAVAVRTAGGARSGSGVPCSRTCRRPPSTADSCRGPTCPRGCATVERFEWDPSTVKVDWALGGPVPWEGAPAAAPRARCTSRTPWTR